MISYRTCSGCKHLKVGANGLECTAIFRCYYQETKKPAWTDHARPLGYRTTESNTRREVR